MDDSTEHTDHNQEEMTMHYRTIMRNGVPTQVPDPEPQYPETEYVGTDHEERYPSAAAINSYERDWYDWAWRRYLNGEGDRPDTPEG